MFEKKPQYHALQGNDDLEDMFSYHPHSPACPRYTLSIGCGLLIASLIANVCLMYDRTRQTLRETTLQASTQSKYG